MYKKELKKRIKEIAGDRGWWTKAGEEAFIDVGERLLDKGIPECEVIELLEICYGAVSVEYGE